MAHIDDVPEAVTGAGQDFDYVNPPALSTVVLVNAPLDPDHVNIGLNRAAYDTFITAEVAAGRAITKQVNLQSPEHDLDLDIPYEEAATFYNYGRLTIEGRAWYIFYTATYLNKTTTRFVADIDEVASYSWSLGYSPIERGHVAVAAALNDTFGGVFLTAPEPVEAPPVRGVLNETLLGSDPSDWTVLVVSANDLRGGTGWPFFDRHTKHDLIAGAADKATLATIDSNGEVQTHIADAHYPWDASGGGASVAALTDVILPGHSVTNPGGTVTSGWAWHMATAGRGGVDLNYSYGTNFKAPGPGTVDHFDVAGVGMVVRLTLDTPAIRTHPQEPDGDAFGPAYSIWFEHCSDAVDGHANEGDVIGKSGDGYGQYPEHLHVHMLTDHSGSAGAGNRANFWNFVGSAVDAAPNVAVPKVEASPVSTIDGVSAGGGVYLFTMAGFAEYMTIMQGAPWVTSGIIDVRLVPSWAVGGGGDATFTPVVPSQDPSDDSWSAAASIPEFVGKVVSHTVSQTVLDGWRDDVLTLAGAGDWTKLLTAQFTDLLVGNGETTRSFRPDQWPHPGLTFQAVSGAAHGDPSIRLIPNGYNDLGSQMGLDTPVGGKAGLAHTGFGVAASQVASQDLSPYLSAYGSYTAWITALKNKSLAIELSLTNIQLNAGVQGIQTVMGAAQGAAGGALAGGGAGAIGGAATAGISALGSMATAGITASNTITMLDVSQNGSFDITAFQLGLSGEAALASFDTWYQSLSSASGGGSAHQIASGWRAIIAQAFSVIVSIPSAERIKVLVSMWERYGYMIGQNFRPGRLDPMTKFSYWQTGGAVILGAVPQQRRQTIAAAFDRGTTVWTVIADIGSDVTASNAPRTGITY